MTPRIYFPRLHPSLLPAPLPEGVNLFDPGLAAGDDAPRLRPDGLPLEPRAAAAYVRDALAYGSQFPGARDMAALAAAGPQDFYRDTALDIASSLSGMDSGAAEADAARKAQAGRQAAQSVLLLAWTLEERLLELTALDARAEAGWNKFDAILGLGDDAGEPSEADPEEEALAATLAQSGARAATLPTLAGELPEWRRILAAMAVLAPDALFVTFESEVAEDLDDADLTAESADPASLGLGGGAGGKARLYRVPVAFLQGRRRAKDGPAVAVAVLAAGQ